MKDILKTVIDNALPVAGGLCAGGAACGALGLVLPTTGLFLLAGLVLMTASGRRSAVTE